MSKAKFHFAVPRRPRPYLVPRQSKRSKILAFFILILASINFIIASRAYRSALEAKYSPTTYKNLSVEQEEALAGKQWRWNSGQTHGEQIPGYSRQNLWDNRQDWKALSSGFEGDTFTFNGVVVKVYRPTNAPFRNCLPGEDLRWPTEISASLVLTGLPAQIYVGENASFVPVIDYFLAPGHQYETATWHLVTPFLPSGHLKTLAKRLKQSDARYVAQELDIVFRKSFEHILVALDEMHALHGICHDDIKQDNIFLAHESTTPNETTSWLLADLGNVRHIDHPYHFSPIWARSNLRDCRANDVFRLVKAYMKFLSRAVDNKAEFNEQFLAGETAWSRLFWATWYDVQQKQPASAVRLLSRSRSFDFVPDSPSRPSGFGGLPAELRDPTYWSLTGRERALARAVKDMLFYGATEIPARLWGLTPILGIPVPDCHA